MSQTLSRRAFLRSGAQGACAASLMLAGCQTPGSPKHAKLPNIVFVLADDMGIGDLGCYNAASAIPTPRFDALAAEGMRFTDAHTAGAVCVPSRYGIMTGRYFWRGSNRGMNAYSKNEIELERLTLADMLHAQGYHTNYIGKWHLGLSDKEPVDFFQPLHPNPTDHGFDSFFGIPASLDMAPYVYVENEHVLEAPTEQTDGTPFGTGPFYREGAIAPGFKHADVLPRLTKRAVEVIESHARQAEDQPLFLYFAMNAPHTPWVPEDSVLGKSRAGQYGDYVHQTDRSLGEVLDALERTGLAENTLLIAASDNGGMKSWLPAVYKHQMNGAYRGQKGDVWEGGHRVPMIVRWPGEVEAGSTNDALFSMTDLLMTFAQLTGGEVPEDAAEDSLDMSAAFRGKPGPRREMVHESVRGVFGLRAGDWKYIRGLGGGGIPWKAEEHQPKPGEAPGELFNMRDDPAEQHNLYLAHPEIVTRLSERLDVIRAGSRTRP